MWQFYPTPPITLNRRVSILACVVVCWTYAIMPNFNSIGSGVSEPQLAENRYFVSTAGITFTTIPSHEKCTQEIKNVTYLSCLIRGNYTITCILLNKVMRTHVMYCSKRILSLQLQAWD